MTEQNELISLMTALAPAALFILVAAFLWLVVRALLRLFRSSATRPVDIPVPPDDLTAQERREPVLEPAKPVTVSTIPDAADVLALKASIDALTRQIASLERKLTPVVPAPPPSVPPRIKEEEIGPISVGPRLSS